MQRCYFAFTISEIDFPPFDQWHSFMMRTFGDILAEDEIIILFEQLHIR